MPGYPGPSHLGVGTVRDIVLSLCTQGVHMQTERVGIREFRENLSEYLESAEPVAITRHGQTIGFYIPAKRSVTEADKEALRAAGERLNTWMASVGLDEDSVVEEFKAVRKARRTGR